jgi:hypothetical protein
VASAERVNEMFIAMLLIAIAFVLIALNRRNPASTILIIFLILLISFASSYSLAHYTTQFPDLKNEPTTVALTGDDSYIDDYFSGLMDPEKLMDRYFRQNQTAIIFAEPSTEWFRICSRVENLKDAIASV